MPTGKGETFHQQTQRLARFKEAQKGDRVMPEHPFNQWLNAKGYMHTHQMREAWNAALQEAQKAMINFVISKAPSLGTRIRCEAIEKLIAKPTGNRDGIPFDALQTIDSTAGRLSGEAEGIAYDDLPPIDITGGCSAVEHVEKVRDGD